MGICENMRLFRYCCAFYFYYWLEFELISRDRETKPMPALTLTKLWCQCSHISRINAWTAAWRHSFSSEHVTHGKRAMRATIFRASVITIFFHCDKRPSACRSSFYVLYSLLSFFSFSLFSASDSFVFPADSLLYYCHWTSTRHWLAYRTVRFCMESLTKRYGTRVEVTTFCAKKSIKFLLTWLLTSRYISALSETVEVSILFTMGSPKKHQAAPPPYNRYFHFRWAREQRAFARGSRKGRRRNAQQWHDLLLSLSREYTNETHQ